MNSRMKPKSLKLPQDGLNEGTMIMVSMRMPVTMVTALKRTAAKKQMPYQAMIRYWLAEKLKMEN